ncbi:MAG: hypothetical protein ACYCOU_02815 [Sulfobacillus sp.]
MSDAGTCTVYCRYWTRSDSDDYGPSLPRRILDIVEKHGASYSSDSERIVSEQETPSNYRIGVPRKSLACFIAELVEIFLRQEKLSWHVHHDYDSDVRRNCGCIEDAVNVLYGDPMQVIFQYLEPRDIWRLRKFNDCAFQVIESKAINFLSRLFDRELPEIPFGDICSALKEDRAVISGSAILQALIGCEFVGADIDVFVPCGSGKTFEKLVRTHRHAFRHIISDTSRQAYSESGITYIREIVTVPCKTGLDMQIIYGKLDTKETVRKFDLDVCQNYFDGEHMHVGYPESVFENKFRVLPSSRNLSRILKYQGRGFSLLNLRETFLMYKEGWKYYRFLPVTHPDASAHDGWVRYLLAEGNATELVNSLEKPFKKRMCYYCYNDDSNRTTIPDMLVICFLEFSHPFYQRYSCPVCLLPGVVHAHWNSNVYIQDMRTIKEIFEEHGVGESPKENLI